MAGDNEVKLIITAQDNASATLNQLQEKTQQFGMSIKEMAAQSAMAFGAIAAAGTAMISDWIKKASENAAIQNQLNAVIASTKGISGETVKSMNELTDSLFNMTSVGKDAIASGNNMLLTFTSIGKDVMPEASLAMLNMATAMSGGVEPSAEKLKDTAIQLGKALNDPEKGMTALRRVGVAFTDQQQEQIKAMQKSGDIMGAQKLILRELTTEFGGSAEMLNKGWGGAVRKFNQSMEDMKESLGTAVTETLEPFLNILSDLVKQFNALDEPTKKIIANAVLFATVFAAAGAVLAGFIFLANPVTLTITALVVAATALYVAWNTNFMGIRDITMSVWNNIKGYLMETWQNIQSWAITTFGKMASDMKDIWAKIQKFWKDHQEEIKLAWTIWTAYLKATWDMFWTTITTALDIAWTLFAGVIKIGLDLISLNWKQAWEDIKDMFGKIWTSLRGAADKYVASLSEMYVKWYEGLKTSFETGLFRPLLISWTKFWVDIYVAVDKVVGQIQGVLDSLIKSIEWILQAPAALGQAAIGIAQGAQNAVNNVIWGGGGPPHNAVGGSVDASPRIVGEQGPELFIPSGSGQIVPNNQLSSGGGNKTLVVNINGPVFDKQQAMKIMDMAFDKFKFSTQAF